MSDLIRYWRDRVEQARPGLVVIDPDALSTMLDRVEAAEAKASREVADIVRVSAVTYEATQQAMSVTAEVLSKMGYEGLTKRLSAAEQALQRVREQHEPFTWSFGYGPVQSCKWCADHGVSQEVASWPCPTIRALEGDE